MESFDKPFDIKYGEQGNSDIKESVQKEEKIKPGSNIEVYIDEDGQMTLFDPEDNYFPVATDYAKIPNRFIEKYGRNNYFANLGMMMGITKIEERHHEAYEGTIDGQFYDYIKKKTGTDYSDGLIACFPAAEFIKVFSINRGGKTYKKIDVLWNGEVMRNMWQILYEDDEIVAGTNVLTGTMYDKKHNLIYMKYNYDLKGVLTDYKKFANISFPVLGKLKDEFLTSVYEIFKKHLDFEMQKNKKYGLYQANEIQFEIGLEQFYFLVGLFPLDVTSPDTDMQKVVELLKIKDYKAAAETMLSTGIVAKYDKEQKTALETAINDFSYFRKHYLERAFRKINGFAPPVKLDKPNDPKFPEALKQYREQCTKAHPTDIHFRYSTLRKGAGARVASITFYLSKAEYAEKIIEQRKPDNGNKSEEPLGSTSEALTLEQYNLIDTMREVLPVKLATVNLIALAKAAAWDIERIKKGYAVAEGYSKTHAITDLVPFMISAITNNWEPPVTMDAKETEEYSMAKIKDTLGYNDVILMNPEYQDTLDAFMEVIYETLNSDAATVKIGEGKIPSSAVKSTLLKLTPFDLEYAIKNFLEGNKSKVILPTYVLTILYRANMQKELEIQRNLHQDLGYVQPGARE